MQVMTSSMGEMENDNPPQINMKGRDADVPIASALYTAVSAYNIDFPSDRFKLTVFQLNLSAKAVRKYVRP